MKRSLAAVLAVTICTALGCGARVTHRPVYVVVCGTYLGVGGVGFQTSLSPVPNAPYERAPRRSLLPPPASAAHPPSGTFLKAIITGDPDNCETGPIVTIQPRNTTWTMAIARAKDGGIVGLRLAVKTTITPKHPITIRAYRNGQLTAKAVYPPEQSHTPTPATSDSTRPSGIYIPPTRVPS